MKKTNKWLSIIRFIPFVLCVILIICCFASNEEISVQTILKYTPENPFGAALILLLLYAVKSVSVVFPLLILEIAGGHLFPAIPALIINNLGVLICHNTAYWIGRCSGSAAIDKLVQKYPVVAALLDKQSNNTFFMCFFTRTLACFPKDIVSMYFGATKTPFWCYITASSLGALLNTTLATLFGASIAEPSSPMFWISLLLMVLFAGGSLLFYFLYKHKINKKNR